MAADKKPPLQSSNNANIPAKTIEETYQKKSQLEHILLRPDTYIGSVEKHTQTLWVYENNEMVNRSISYVPGLYKIFDEILVNAADNKQRDPSMDTVKVEIDPVQNLISVYNNGDGVPVEIHQEEKIYVPEMIFGHLLTSSNYDDNERKTTGGRNGYGAKLTNIFSTEFTIETADGKRLKRYKQVFTNNMGSKSTPHIIKCKANENWTKVTFKPDLEKFKMTYLEEDVVALMKKRVIDIAGCLGKTVKVELNGQKVPVKSFGDYCNLYLKSANQERGEPHKCITEKINDRWEICVTDSDGQFQQVSFVNSIATIKGGTHVDYVTNQIANHLMNAVNNKRGKNKAATLKAHAAKSYVWIFVNALIDNPAFDSQTKETLTTRQSSFGTKCELSDDILKRITTKLDIVERLTAWAEFKQSKDLKKTDGAKRGRVTGINKLEDANDAGGRNSDQCTLILTEGDSAKALAMSGLTVVGRNYYGVFPLRGKLLNVREASHKQIMENAEIQHLKQILGLQHGKKYEDVKSLRYGHLMIMTDQDHDGSHIKGLLINFIHSFWPSLLQIPSFLLEFITPIVKATKKVGNKEESKAFYTLPEYESWKESLGREAKCWKIKYYKGLGTSTSKEALEYFKDLKTHKKEFQWVDPQDGEAIEMAFSKKKIEARKNWLRQFKPGTFLGQKEKLIRYSDFVNKELILFSIADLQRSIPSMVDGLKPGQRKILFCAFKRNLVSEVKVAQFSGYVSEHSAYHHGEQSLAGTIVGMAQDFVGSNNINLLQPNGMFGSRMQGGKDAASSRYIHTSLSPVTRALFPKDDDGILEYLNDDGQPIEPFWYIPVIPLVLVNGSEGIGTGWSSYIPNYNPRDIVANVRRILNGEEMEPMHPWYRGFKGRIEKTAIKEGGVTYTVSGIIEEVDETTLRILELPIRKWTDEYKVFLESLMTGNEKIKEPILLDVQNHSDESTIEYDVFMTEKNLDMAKQEGLLKVFKLTTNIGTGNMHLFDPKGVIKKYDTPEQILEEFFHLRLEHYEKRKKFVIDNRSLELLKLDNKVRFILGVVRGEIKVNNRKRMDLFQELHQKGFTPFPKKAKVTEIAVAGVDEVVDENDDGAETVSKGVQASDYDYLLSLAIGTLTLEKVQELCAEKDRVEKEIEELRKITPAALWLKDLDLLEKELDKQDKRDAEAEASRREERQKNMAKDAKKNIRNGGQARKRTTKKANDSTISESVAAPVDPTTETGNVVPAVKPKGRGGPRKAPAKKKVVSIDSDEEKEDDDVDVLELKDRLAKYTIDSSPDQPKAGMEVEHTMPEAVMMDKAESDEEFVVAAGKKKGGRKPAAAKTGKPAAAAGARKRGPAANKKLLNQTLITDTLKPAESSPDKKVRKIRASPFNKKSSSVLGRIGGGGSAEQASGGSSSSASGSPDGDSEVVAVKARPVRANRKPTKYVVSESEEEEDDDSADSEFDMIELDDNDD